MKIKSTYYLKTSWNYKNVGTPLQTRVERTKRDIRGKEMHPSLAQTGSCPEFYDHRKKLSKKKKPKIDFSDKFFGQRE